MCLALLARWAHFKPWLGSNHARHAHAEVSATLSVSLLPSACVSLAATPPVAPIHRRAPAVMAACIVQVQASAQCLVLVRQVRSPFQVRQPSLAHRAPPANIKTEWVSPRAHPAAQARSKTYRGSLFVTPALPACTAQRRH